ncbi:MAG: hypothetical protein IRY87_22820 [Acetobacteraceae bacterium]|nr:hypothetical protein [Acetobacteraceae bacterium]
MNSLSSSRAEPLVESAGSAARPLLTIAGCILLVSLALLLGILLRNDGHFAYTLDAPYTQMALAEQIARGTYGLNPGEPASPSSSILYPFLLALLSGLPLGQFAPLLICLAATILAAWLLYAVAQEAGVEVERLTTAQLAAITVTLTLALNLAGLAFAGLEHSLHVTLTITSLLGLLRFIRRKEADWWWLAAITLLPLLRFEAAAALVADMLVLLAFRKWRHALGVGLVGAVTVGAFCLYLHSLGLPWLPSSVLSRSDVASAGIGMGGGILGLPRALYAAYRTNLMAFGGTHIAVMIVVLLWSLARSRAPAMRVGAVEWARPVAVGFFVLVALAQLTAGSLSSFSRYEIYVLALGIAVFLVAYAPEANGFLRRITTFRCAALCLSLLFVFSGYVFRTVDAVSAAGNIHDQQYQLHRFVVEHWRRPFAADHPGWVNFRTPYYMLELSGLGSEEARRAKANAAGPDWMDDLARRHDVGLAMLYDSLSPKVPGGWQPVARLRLKQRVVSAPGSTITFYATRSGEAETILAGLKQMAPSLPRGAILDFLTPAR